MVSGVQQYYTTSNVQITSNDQQPPVLQPQQQPTGLNLPQQRVLRYTYQQPEHQQIYSSHGTSPSYAYSSSLSGLENSTGTTTIYMTQQQLMPQQPSYGTSNQVEYEQDSPGRSVCFKKYTVMTVNIFLSFIVNNQKYNTMWLNQQGNNRIQGYILIFSLLVPVYSQPRLTQPFEQFHLGVTNKWVHSNNSTRQFMDKIVPMCMEK